MCLSSSLLFIFWVIVFPFSNVSQKHMFLFLFSLYSIFCQFMYVVLRVNICFQGSAGFTG